jgi:Pentapeptide repeats (8 copies)
VKSRYAMVGCVIVAVVALGAAAWFAGPSIAGGSNWVSLPLARLVLVAVAVTLTLLWVVPKLQVSRLTSVSQSERFKLENDARTTLAQILGGAFLLLGLVATWTTIRISERGQFTERFTKAINQIADKQLDSRVAGIFSLEALAKESPQDRASITQVLSTFVRTHAPVTKSTGARVCPDTTIDLAAQGRARAANHIASEEWPPQDVQTALTILGKQETTLGAPHLQLAGTDLECAYLEGADLSDANFQQTHLEGAWLLGARFDGAILMGTVVTRAILNDATFAHADLRGAIFLHAFNVKCDNLAQADYFLGAELPPDCTDALRKQAEEERSLKSSPTGP